MRVSRTRSRSSMRSSRPSPRPACLAAPIRTLYRAWLSYHPTCTAYLAMSGSALTNTTPSTRACATPAHYQDEKRSFLGEPRRPTPSRGRGPGCAGLRPASAGRWGNQVSPSPCSRAAPAHTLLRAGGGETRFPHPSAPSQRDATRLFLGGPGPPKPSHRVRGGETRFPCSTPTG